MIILLAVGLGFAVGTLMTLHKLGPLAAIPWLLSTVMAFAMSWLAVTVRTLGDRLARLDARADSEPVALPAVVALPVPDDAEAVGLLRAAQDRHFGKDFAEARQLYAELVQRCPGTKQAAVAAQQLDNLRKC